MTLAAYGVLKGTVLGHRRDADDDHYQILLQAGKALHRVAINVKSSAPNAPSTVLFASTTTLPDAFKQGLMALTPGYRKLTSKPGGLALDYVRSGIVKPKAMKPLPPDRPGANNDLKDTLEAAVIRAMKEDGAQLYAFGVKWGPETNKPDQYFKFTPGSGIHDIHMNQGNSGKYIKDNGTYQDGALVIQYPGGTWRAFFVAFQSQSFDTDSKGNVNVPAPKAVPATRPTAAKRAASTTKGKV